MFKFSLLDKFKSLDIYRKLPSDYVQPTYSGALCKILFYKINYSKFSILNQCYNNAFIIIE